MKELIGREITIENAKIYIFRERIFKNSSFSLSLNSRLYTLNTCILNGEPYKKKKNYLIDTFDSLIW